MLTLEEFKKSLGETGKKLSNKELQKLYVMMDYLSDKWLDQSEKVIFGTTIKNLTGGFNDL